MPVKKVDNVEVTDVEDYLSNAIYRACRGRHDLRPWQVEWTEAYDDPHCNLEKVIPCQNGCGYVVRKRSLFDGRHIVLLKPTAKYTDPGYLVKGVKVTGKDGERRDIEEFLASRDEAVRLEKARKRTSRKAVPMPAMAVRGRPRKVG